MQDTIFFYPPLQMKDKWSFHPFFLTLKNDNLMFLKRLILIYAYALHIKMENKPDHKKGPFKENESILSQLSPAETLIMLLGKEAPFNDLMKVTLMDLMLKQVLAIKEVMRQPGPSEKIRIYKYIVRGENFAAYTPLAHEFIFLNVFNKYGKEKLLFRHLIRAAYDNIASSGL
jgi:hypothetical protein